MALAGCLVHLQCYGGSDSSESNFMCDACMKGLRDSDRFCILCPQEDGALKPTQDGRWAHQACAMYFPNIYEEGGLIRGLHHVPRKCWLGVCCICCTSEGATVTCQAPDCDVTFHVGCAIRSGGAHVRLVISENELTCLTLCKDHAM